MAAPLIPAHYPLSWALSIVQRLERKHTRGLQLFIEFSGLSRRQLAKLLADGRPEFQVCRKIIQKLEIWDERVRIGFADTRTLMDLFCGKTIAMPTKMRDYLTPRIEAIQLKSRNQGEAMGGGLLPPIHGGLDS